MVNKVDEELRRELTSLKLTLSNSQIEQLLSYLGLIQKWSKVYNLTAVRNPAEILTRHVLDCLAVIGSLRAQLAAFSENRTPEQGLAGNEIPKIRLLDVGSGAGLPGVIVAICCPDLMVDCVDAVGKKAAFIRQVAITLGICNLQGLHARVEKLTDKYSIICCRAFASLADFTHWSSAVLADNGIWLAMKGKWPTDEMAELPTNIEVFHVEQLSVPGLSADRCLVWLRKT
jgi:16S rRNA (guanine527-N7)-methyltransferase